jgi:glycosyltransferase involved in cell wall biosynthesis
MPAVRSPDHITVTLIITSLDTGGAQRMLLKLLRCVDRTKFSIHVISLTGEGDLGKDLTALDYPVSAIRMQKGVFGGIGGFWRLIMELRRIRPDIVQTWMYHADFLGGLAAKVAGVDLICWNIRHSNLDNDKNKQSTIRIARACALISSWLPRVIVTNSNRAKSVHARLGYALHKFVVIPNGFDVSEFAPNKSAKVSVCAELGISAASPVVGFVGRLDPLKNHAGFLEAAALVLQRLPGTHFILAGTGVVRGNPSLDPALSTLPSGNVHLLGPRTDMPRLMSAFDVFAMSSLGEAFPNVLGEAMLCGVPCIATDVGDCAEILGNGGTIVHPGDPAALAGAISELLMMSPSARDKLGELGRARAIELFELGQVTRRYERVFEGMLIRDGFIAGGCDGTL